MAAFDRVWQNRWEYGSLKEHSLPWHAIQNPDGNILVWKDPMPGAPTPTGSYSFMFAHWSGPELDRLIPWQADLCRKLEPLGVEGIIWQVFTGDLPRHFDGQGDAKNGCHLLYVAVLDDPTAETVSQSRDNLDHVIRLPSKIGTAYLLDTNQWHWVNNQALRVTLRMHVKLPFDQALAWWGSQDTISI